MEHPKVHFPHPALGYNVYATLDICHMLKLARNALGSMGHFHTADGQQISWSYIHNLCNLQNQIGLKFANKLSNRHIQWEKAKMKVKLAAQVFSSSVASALEFLQSVHEDYQDVSATVEFIRQVSSTSK